MKVYILALAAILSFVSSKAQTQDPAAQYYGNQISADELKEYLSIIASDALEGRKTGSRGQKMAAAFISAHFHEIGLTGPVNGSYYQSMNLYTSSVSEAYLKVGQTKFENYSSVVYYGSADTGGQEISFPVVFVGNATEADFNQVDVKDKAVLFFSKETRLTGSATVALAREKGAKLILVSNTENISDFDVLSGQVKGFLSAGRLSVDKPRGSEHAGIFMLSPPAVEKIMGTTVEKLRKAAAEDPKKNALKKIKPSVLQYKVTLNSVVKTDNVLGFLEGTDKKDEVVIITAHYDHLGKKSSGEGDLIYNGADDDGSGTVAVMELAKVFAKAKKDGKGPRRSILFMTVTGEEGGLMGSDYYSRNPIFPLEKTVVDLNIDMVGRKDPQHKDSAPYVYVVGSNRLSADLHTLSENINKTYTNLAFDYTYNDESHPDRIYYRSDHWNFAKKNIPIIFYFDGIIDDYHKVTDEVEKIEFDLLAKRAQLVFYTAWEIANRDVRITADPDKIKK
jgi:hypothetical protein